MSISKKICTYFNTISFPKELHNSMVKVVEDLEAMRDENSLLYKAQQNKTKSTMVSSVFYTLISEVFTEVWALGSFYESITQKGGLTDDHREEIRERLQTIYGKFDNLEILYKAVYDPKSPDLKYRWERLNP